MPLVKVPLKRVADDDVSAFMKVYEIQTNRSPQYNPKDFIDFIWFTPLEVLQRIQDGEQAKGDLPKLIRLFYTSRQ